MASCILAAFILKVALGYAMVMERAASPSATGNPVIDGLLHVAMVGSYLLAVLLAASRGMSPALILRWLGDLIVKLAVFFPCLLYCRRVCYHLTGPCSVYRRQLSDKGNEVKFSMHAWADKIEC